MIHKCSEKLVTELVTGFFAMALGKKELDWIVSNPTHGKQKTYKHELGLNLRESQRDNTLTWEGRLSFEGKQFRISYGVYPRMTLRQAEKAHQEAKQLAKEGIDPRLERNQENVKDVKGLCLKWLELYASKQRKRPELAERDILKDIVPAIGHIKLAIFKKRHVNACIDPIMKRGSTAHARKVLGLLRQVCSWGVERDYLQENPTADISKANIHKSRLRDRVLSDKEIATVWQVLPTLGLSVQIVLATKALILTGQRRNEIINAQWQHIDFDNKTWFMPDTKNGKPHRVPLSAQAIALFQELKHYAGDSRYVIPAASGDKPMSEKALTRAIARKQSAFNIEYWTPHDLRRTFITGCNSLGIQPHLVELLVNHALPAMLQPYLIGKKSMEIFELQRAAIGQWADHVGGLVNA